MPAEMPAALRREVRTRARSRCEYCQTAEWLSGIRGEVDHIIPRSQGGPTTGANLCLACVSCNGHKQSQTHARDPESDVEVTLFNPRQQLWREHFAWSEDGTLIQGLTPCGRATVVALQLNHALIVAARSIWASIRLHPPQE